MKNNGLWPWERDEEVAKAFGCLGAVLFSLGIWVAAVSVVIAFLLLR